MVRLSLIRRRPLIPKGTPHADVFVFSGAEMDIRRPLPRPAVLRTTSRCSTRCLVYLAQLSSPKPLTWHRGPLFNRARRASIRRSWYLSFVQSSPKGSDVLSTARKPAKCRPAPQFKSTPSRWFAEVFLLPRAFGSVSEMEYPKVAGGKDISSSLNPGPTSSVSQCNTSRALTLRHPPASGSRWAAFLSPIPTSIPTSTR